MEEFETAYKIRHANCKKPDPATPAANAEQVRPDGRGDGNRFAQVCHPLLREHFAAELREQHPDARREGHRRLYEYLCATTPDKPDATLEDLQPLYQAVAHGCQAGLQQEACDKVYFARIHASAGSTTASKKLGAFGSDLGAIACFFEPPWSRLSPRSRKTSKPAAERSRLHLRALGRLTEALEPMRATVEMNASRSEWKERRHQPSNLSELELTLGEVAGAVGDAERSVTYADRSGDAFQRYSKRTTHADALHQAGRRAEAEARFREAEQMQAESQPEYPLLYSLQGFRYCDLLLAAAERAAWRRIWRAAGVSPLVPRQRAEHAEDRCGSRPPFAVRFWKPATPSPNARRRRSSGPSLQQLSLLDIALDHLTLGRAALYAAILQESPLSNLKSEIEQAVSGLRRAGQQHMLSLGLLTRAWLRFLTAARTGPESAQSDLDEAWEIAQRGPMPLFLADIHRLSRVRLFGNRFEGAETVQGEVTKGRMKRK